MKYLSLILASFLMATPAKAQLSIENPAKLPLAREEAEIAYRIAREQVISEISPARPDRVPELPLVLKLGCADAAGKDYYGTDELVKKGRLQVTSVICLKSWDLGKFAFGVMRITERQVIPTDRYMVILEQSLEKIRSVSPVDVGELKLKK
jgi:hypothetical protein